MPVFLPGESHGQRILVGYGSGIAIVGQDIELSLWHKLTQYCKAIILQLKVKEKIFF